MTQMVKHLPAMQETWVQSLDREDLLEKEMAAHSVLLPGKFHGLRSLVGYSSWGCKELDTTEQLHSLTHSYRKKQCIVQKCKHLKLEDRKMFFKINVYNYKHILVIGIY